jgi:serpin B
MMEQTGEFQYQEAAGYQAVCLPYSNWDAAMYVFLPSRPQRLPTLLGSIRADPRKWLDRFQPRDGTVVLPRFRLECDLSLVPALRAIGLADLFSTDACNLSGAFLDDDPVFVNTVHHRAVVEVNEEGTEAAAATAMGYLRGLPHGSALEPFRMIVDRPFLFLICDNNTGTLLFSGAIYDPTG